MADETSATVLVLRRKFALYRWAECQYTMFATSARLTFIEKFNASRIRQIAVGARV